MDPTALQPPSRTSQAAVVWQGWRLDLPARWNPVKLEGDYASGHALFMDLYGPRLGLMWKKASGRKFSPDQWARQTLLAEVGTLAAAEARPQPDLRPWQAARLYVDPEPPGRDVWLAYSPVSARCVVLTYFARRRERILAELVVPTLADLPADRDMPWAVFELSCAVPPGLPLVGRTLNAGDLSLSFADRRRQLTVRQIAVAQLALKRLSIESWLIQQEQTRRKHYRPMGQAQAVQLAAMGRVLEGVGRPMRRRRRFFWRRGLPRGLWSCVLHDTARDRLVIGQGTDRALVEEALATVGWATRARLPADREDER